MTHTTRPIDPERFLRVTRGRTFAEAGVFMLILSHLAMTPGHKMTRAGIHATLRTRTPFAVETVDNIIDAMFDEDEEGNVSRHRMAAQASAEAATGGTE